MNNTTKITVVSFSGGTNSTAMLVGLHEHGIRPDYITFADTGGELPSTYEYHKVVSEWLVKVGFPPITRIPGGCTPKSIADGTLEQELLRLHNLPALAFGRRSCSKKWKIRPFNEWVKAQELPLPGIKMIGFDADECHRMDRAPVDPNWELHFPLIKWWWGRKECVAAISRAGLPQPGKTSCFFCPACKPAEILALPPDLLERALEIERRALAKGNLRSVKGLGRKWSWASLVKQQVIPGESVPIHCNCYDG